MWVAQEHVHGRLQARTLTVKRGKQTTSDWIYTASLISTGNALLAGEGTGGLSPSHKVSLSLWRAVAQLSLVLAPKLTFVYKKSHNRDER